MNQKCSHAGCTCAVSSGNKFCSEECSRRHEQGRGARCGCRHPACAGAGQPWAEPASRFQVTSPQIGAAQLASALRSELDHLGPLRRFAPELDDTRSAPGLWP